VQRTPRRVLRRLALLLLPALLAPIAARAQSAPPLRISVQAEGWTEISSDPRVWRCGGCDPTVVVTFGQRDDAWPDMPAEVRALHGSAFTSRVLADPEQRRALLDGILREVRAGVPGLKVEASLAGARTIGSFDFVEARARVRYGKGLTAATAFLTFHRGWLIQVTVMYGVDDLPERVARQVERFLGGIAFEE
jgi:hypothetical protein